jgi:hypothetical protein
MKGENHGIPFNRCDLCAVDTPDEAYCKKCRQSCCDDASVYLDKLCMTYDTDLAYECMTKILEGRK